jgi:hypothetical protein
VALTFLSQKLGVVREYTDSEYRKANSGREGVKS